MTCSRCLSLMLPIASLAHECTADYTPDTTDRQTDQGSWKCTVCGNIEDPVILRHRRRLLVPVPVSIGAAGEVGL